VQKRVDEGGFFDDLIVETMPRSGNGRGEAGRTGADDEDVANVND
jgi:hypothetical protein